MKYLKLLTIVFTFLLLFPIVFSHHEPTHEQCPPNECPRDVDSFVEGVISEKLMQAAVISFVLFGVGSLAVIFFGLKKKKKHPLKMFFNICFVAIFILMGYSYYYFTATASETTGIVVCEAGECFWAAHIHALLYIDVCGEQIDLGLEEGPLEATHTHKEKNKLHFHERLTVDPETREVTDFTPLEIETVLNNFGIETREECIAGTCKGDMCNGKAGLWNFSIQRESTDMATSALSNPLENWENYAWKDGDIITILFK